jgi:hypothetical protein
LNPKSTAKKADSVAKKDRRPEMVSRRFVFEFVNAALYGRSTVVVAPDFQRGAAAIGDKNPKDVARANQ